MMAQKIQAALRAAAPLLILDEDRSATNLLVPGCLQSGEVTPLSTLLATRREAFGRWACSSPRTLRRGSKAVLLHVRHSATRSGFEAALNLHNGRYGGRFVGQYLPRHIAARRSPGRLMP